MSGRTNRFPPYILLFAVLFLENSTHAGKPGKLIDDDGGNQHRDNRKAKEQRNPPMGQRFLLFRFFLRTICKQGTEGRGLFLGTRCEIV